MYTDIDIDTYKKDFAEADTDYLLVDVREDDEYAEGHLPNAISIPLSVLQDRYSEIDSSGKPIVLVCARGGRSAKAAEFIASKGYTNLYNLEGGTMEWKVSGNPLEK